MTSDEFSYDIKIPLERVGVLIGPKGEVKKQIEEALKIQLQITAEGDVNILGDDGLNLFTAREIVQAIGRGFNPKTAILLTNTDYSLEIVNLKDAAGKNKNTMERLKGRVIGTGGKAREEVERLTDTNICVYGKTISIIGETGQVTIARDAMAMLINGSMHKTVYQFLEKRRKENMFEGRL